MIDQAVAVRCSGVQKSYGTGNARIRALRQIDIEIRAGELMMLVGPSGSGKTTLISVIAGILDQDEGECSVFGQDLKALSNHDKTTFRGKNIGFVFQAFNLLPTLTAAENVAVPLLINRVPFEEAVERGAQALAKVGLGERTKSMPSQLSGGQQQRVAIARAMVHDPRLIVCDEPTSALDHVTGAQVLKLLREVALQDGRSLVIVTHDSRIFEFADRIAVMEDGSIQKIVDSPKDL